MKTLITLALAASTALAMPAAAQQNRSSSVSVTSPLGVSAVTDTTNIQMPAIPGGVAVYERNPAFFEGASLCVAGLDDNWPIRPDGTLHREQPILRADGTVERIPTSARTPSCAPLVHGRATVSNPFGPRAVPFILRGDRIVGWAGRDRLSGLAN